MILQGFDLFPNMSVLKNCALAPMRTRGASVICMADGEVLEEWSPEAFFRNAQHPHTHGLLGEILARH